MSKVVLSAASFGALTKSRRILDRFNSDELEYRAKVRGIALQDLRDRYAIELTILDVSRLFFWNRARRKVLIEKLRLEKVYPELMLKAKYSPVPDIAISRLIVLELVRTKRPYALENGSLEVV